MSAFSLRGTLPEIVDTRLVCVSSGAQQPELL